MAMGPIWYPRYQQKQKWTDDLLDQTSKFFDKSNFEIYHTFLPDDIHVL